MRKFNILLSIVVITTGLILQSCHKLYEIAAGPSENRLTTIRTLEETSRSRPGVLLTRDTVYAVGVISLSEKLIYFEDLAKNENDSISFSDLYEIRYVDYGKGSREGALISFGAGFLMGFGMGSALWASDSEGGLDGPGLPFGFGAVLGTGALPIGAIVGAAHGSKVIYRAEGVKPKSRKTRRGYWE